MKRKLMGILAVGGSRQQAINNYRLLALGKGATVVADEGGNSAFVVQATSTSSMFNPVNGEMNFVERPQLLDRLEFQSESSEVEVEVHMAHCGDGCGAYVIAESADVLNHCPRCTQALSLCDDEEECEDEEGDDEIVSADDLAVLDEDDAARDEGGEEEDEPVSESSSSLRRIRRSFSSAEDDSDDSEPDDASGDENTGGDDTSGDDEISGDSDVPEEDDDESTLEGEAEPLVVVSSSADEAVALFVRECQVAGGLSVSSSEDAHITAQYFVCESGEHHVVANARVSSCPVCKKDLCEPSEQQVAAVSVSTEVDFDEDGEEAAEETSSDDGASSDAESDAEEGSTDAEEGSTDAEEGSTDAESGAEVESDEDDSEVESTSSEDGEDEEEGDDEEVSEDNLSVVDDDATEGVVTPLDDVSDDEEVDNLDVSMSSSLCGAPAWTAYVKGVPVAIARVSESNDNADVFETPVFGKALIATASEIGIKRALENMGFKPIHHAVSIPAAIARAVDSSVAEARQSLSSEQAAYQGRLEEALATAAIGINRGFFQGVASTLKAALFDSMSSAGIRNPEKLIDQAFASHFDSFLKQTFAKAGEILAMPEQVQQSLSSTILGTAYQSVSSASESEGGELENRLSSIGQSVSESSEAAHAVSKPSQSGQSASTSSKRKAVIAALGANNFGRR